MASTDHAFSFGTTQIAVPAGATLGLRIVPMAGQIGMQLKYTSGSSLVELVGVPYGSTLTAAQLNTATGTSWLLYSGADTGVSPLEIKGAPMFYPYVWTLKKDMIAEFVNTGRWQAHVEH